MRKYVFVALLAFMLTLGGVTGAQAKRGENNACPPPSPAFPNPDPPSCGKPAPTPPTPPVVGPCEGTLAEDLDNGTEAVPVVGGVIQAPDGAGAVSTPVGGAVSNVDPALGRQAGCLVSTTGQ